MTKQELQQLRQQIVLNSLYTSDYNNSFNIDARQVQDFFDGYVENCDDMIAEGYPCDIEDIDFLWEYYNTYDEDPLSQEFFEKYYKN